MFLATSGRTLDGLWQGPAVEAQHKGGDKNDSSLARNTI
ncbi:hypothetical protein SAMN05216308_101742 [Nitrosospira sp. Nsp13]|nr:hypothetical protein SAMN05216308_101742 [Nitrosospira sp. Nsp13]